MAENSNIEWTNHTFNPWIGCTKVSAGCANCYAEKQDNHRKWTPEGWGKGKPRKRTSEAYWRQPLKWNRDAEGATERPRVFCASLADVFDDEVTHEWRVDLMRLIASTPHLDWLLLTKRPQNVMPFLDWAAAKAEGDDWNNWANWLNGSPPSNVWLGTSVENQQAADERIPHLLKVPAKVRFLSCEPLLGPVDLQLPIKTFALNSTKYLEGIGCDHCCNGDRCDDRSHVNRRFCRHCRGSGLGKPIHWVIAGGESGPNARPMHADWARSLRDQCQEAGVPFLFKQWGEYIHESQTNIAYNGKVRIWPDTTVSYPIGKKAAGRLLDGRTWNEYPEVNHA